MEQKEDRHPLLDDEGWCHWCEIPGFHPNEEPYFCCPDCAHEWKTNAPLMMWLWKRRKKQEK